MILEHIEGPWDVKNLSQEELKTLAAEIRQFLIEKISVTGGHLASNLGVVELTIALYLAFDLTRWMLMLSIRLAGLWPTAVAIAAVISPRSASAMTIPTGPMITSALRLQTITGFSPVAATSAPAFSMADVARLLVPTAVMYCSG